MRDKISSYIQLIGERESAPMGIENVIEKMSQTFLFPIITLDVAEC